MGLTSTEGAWQPTDRPDRDAIVGDEMAPVRDNEDSTDIIAETGSPRTRTRRIAENEAKVRDLIRRNDRILTAGSNTAMEYDVLLFLSNRRALEI